MKKLDPSSKKSCKEHGIYICNNYVECIDPLAKIRQNGPKMLKMILEAIEIQKKKNEEKSK